MATSIYKTRFDEGNIAGYVAYDAQGNCRQHQIRGPEVIMGDGASVTVAGGTAVGAGAVAQRANTASLGAGDVTNFITTDLGTFGRATETNAATNTTLLASQVCGNAVVDISIGGAGTLTLPSAADMEAEYPGLPTGASAVFYVNNNGGGDVALGGNTGMLLDADSTGAFPTTSGVAVMVRRLNASSYTARVVSLSAGSGGGPVPVVISGTGGQSMRFTTGTASSNSAVALGNVSQATQPNTTAVGETSLATGTSATAIGAFCQAAGSAAVTMGNNNSCSGAGTVIVGSQIAAGASTNCVLMGPTQTITSGIAGAVVIGSATSCSNGGAVVIGQGATGANSNVTVVGNAANGAGPGCVAIGDGSSATSGNAIAIGDNNLAGAGNAISIGVGSQCTAADGVVIGTGSSVSGLDSIVIGKSVAIGASQRCVAIGADQTHNNLPNAGVVAVGDNATVGADGVVALGENTTGSALRGISVGNSANNGAADAIGIGSSIVIDAAATDTVCVGARATCGTSIDGVIVGADSTIGNSSPNSTAIGHNAAVAALTPGCLALGAFSSCTAANATAIGQVTNDFANSCRIGTQTTVLCDLRRIATATQGTSLTTGITMPVGSTQGIVTLFSPIPASTSINFSISPQVGTLTGKMALVTVVGASGSSLIPLRWSVLDVSTPGGIEMAIENTDAVNATQFAPRVQYFIYDGA